MINKHLTYEEWFNEYKDYKDAYKNYVKLQSENDKLQYENMQLKKQKDDGIKYIRIYRCYEKIDNRDYLKGRDEIGTLSVKQVDDLLRMLGEIDE